MKTILILFLNGCAFGGLTGYDPQAQINVHVSQPNVGNSCVQDKGCGEGMVCVKLTDSYVGFCAHVR